MNASKPWPHISIFYIKKIHQAKLHTMCWFEEILARCLVTIHTVNSLSNPLPHLQYCIAVVCFNNASMTWSNKYQSTKYHII